MKLILDGKINPYYVQTLCMIFFPGEKFGAGEETREDAPVLKLSLREEPEGLSASVFAAFDGKAATAERFQAYSGEVDRAKTAKLAFAADISLREACLKLGFLSEEEFDRVFRPEEMV